MEKKQNSKETYETPKARSFEIRIESALLQGSPGDDPIGGGGSGGDWNQGGGD